MKLRLFLFLIFSLSIAHAQTITPNESSIVLQSPKKLVST